MTITDANGAVINFEASYSIVDFSDNFCIPNPPDLIGWENNYLSDAVMLWPNNAGMNFCSMISSTRSKCSSIPGIVLRKYVNLCCSP